MVSSRKKLARKKRVGTRAAQKNESPRERGGFLAQQLSYEAYGVAVAVSVAPA